MKYIMVRIEKPTPREFPIIFPAELVHAYMFEAVRGMKVLLPPNRWARPYADIKAVAAGEVTARVESAFGESETLGLQSREQDRTIINTFDYLKGIL